MKESNFSYNFQKSIKSPLDYVINADPATEKIETDSFCKVIFLSKEEEKEIATSSKEKPFGQTNDIKVYEKEKPSITVQVDEDRQIITHSLTFNDSGRSLPKIVFQCSYVFTARDTASLVIEVRASKIKYISSDMRVAISELVQSDNVDVKTTLILQNEKETASQKTQTPNSFIQNYSSNQCTRKYKPNAKFCGDTKFDEDSSRNSSTIISQDDLSCCKSCCKDHFCRPQAGGHTETDFTLYGSSTCSSHNGVWLPYSGLSQLDSPCNETLWDILPPDSFANKESDVVEDLTEDVVSCHINDSSVFKEQKDHQHVPEPLVSKCQFSITLDAQEDLLRPSVTHNHKWNIQMHNNSTNSQPINYKDVQRKRRRTYPGVFYHSSHDSRSKSCRKAFFSGTLSSFFTQSLLYHTETARGSRFQLEDHKLDISGRKNHNSFKNTSSQSSSFCGASSPTYNVIPNIKAFRSTKTQFYPSATLRTSDIFLKSEHEQVEPADTDDQLCLDSVSKDPLKQSEVTESSFDEQMMEVESPVAVTHDTHQKNMPVHVTPPSVYSLEEGITDGFHKQVKAEMYKRQVVKTQKKQGSTVTLKGGYEQRSLHNHSMSDKIVLNHQPTEQLEDQKHVEVEKSKQLFHIPAKCSSQSDKTCIQPEKHLNKADTMKSEDTHSVHMSLRHIEDRGFYTETFHSASWIYRGDDANPNETIQCLSNCPRPVAVRERTVKISKGMGEYPWGFRIQYSKPIIVTEVDTNGAAEDAGLNVGDYVLAVNGTDVTGVPHSEAVDLARQGPDLLILTIGSDIGRTPNTPKPACRGYLHKRTQSSLLRGWRKRWFVLRHDCCLYYHRNKRDEGKSHALAIMQLEGAVVEADTTLGKPFVFKCSPVAGNRVYYFCATSNQEMRRWLEALERAVHPITQNHVWVDVTRHNSNLPPLAIKNPECLGLLNLLDRNKDSWVQHYCILKDGCLYFYTSIRSTYAIGGIYLHGYTVREQSLGFKRSTIELKPPSEEFKVFYFCAENVNENKRWIRAIKTSIGKWLPLHQALQDYMSRPPEETKM